MKRYNNGFVQDPIILHPDDTVNDAKAYADKYGITSFPIVNDKNRLWELLQGDIDQKDDNICLWANDTF